MPRYKKHLLIILAIVCMTAPVHYAYAKTTPKAAIAKSGGKKKNTTVKGSKSKSTAQSKSKTAKKNNLSKPKAKETVADVKKRQEEAQKEIKLTQEQIKANEAAVKKNLVELGKLEGEIESGKKTVDEAAAKVDALQKQILTLQDRISSDEKRLETLRTEYLKAVRKMRLKRKEQSDLAFVFSSGSFNQAMRRMRYLKEVSRWRERQTSEINRHIEALKTEKDRLARTKQMLDRALAQSREAQKQLQSQYTRQDAVVTELKKNGRALQVHLSKKQAEVNSLKNRVAALIAEEQRKAEAEQLARQRAEAERKAKAEEEDRVREQLAQQQDSKETKKAKELKKDKKTTEPKPSKSETPSYAEARKRKPRSENASKQQTAQQPPVSGSTTAGSGFAGMKGSLPRPVAGAFKVTSRFGRNSLPEMPDVVFENPGIDAEVSSGATALAVYPGKVSGVYMIPGYSTVVIISHDGYYTVYGNIASASVKVGDTVKQGQSLGRLELDEDDPAHSMIHFEVWKNRDKQDPLAWIR